MGLLADVHRMATIAFKRAGDAIILVGETRGHLGQSLYLREIEGREEGPPPPVDLVAEKRNGDFVRGLIEGARVNAVHDVSDGGLLVAIAEMAIAAGFGADIVLPKIAAGAIPAAFGEDQARYVISAPQKDVGRILAEAKAARVPAVSIGRTGGSKITMAGGQSVAMSALVNAHESWFPSYMESELPPSS